MLSLAKMTWLSIIQPVEQSVRLEKVGELADATVVSAVPYESSIWSHGSVPSTAGAVEADIRPGSRAPYRAKSNILLPTLQVPLVQPGKQARVRFNPEKPTEFIVALEK